jgi:hypothetical protein
MSHELTQDDDDLEHWWKEHILEFSTFFLLDQLYLFITATSAGAE